MGFSGYSIFLPAGLFKEWFWIVFRYQIWVITWLSKLSEAPSESLVLDQPKLRPERQQIRSKHAHNVCTRFKQLYDTLKMGSISITQLIGWCHSLRLSQHAHFNQRLPIHSLHCLPVQKRTNKANTYPFVTPNPKVYKFHIVFMESLKKEIQYFKNVKCFSKIVCDCLWVSPNIYVIYFCPTRKFLSWSTSNCKRLQWRHSYMNITTNKDHSPP